MRKKKENISLQSARDVPLTEALETEREARYEEIAGENATEGLGPRYTTEPRLERSIELSDGPLAGESLAPPLDPTELDITGRELHQSKRRRRKPHHRMATRHAAARSPRKL
jgi:hypothetical protein